MLAVVKQDARDISDARATRSGNMVRVAFYAPPELVDDFRALAVSEARTVSQQLRKMMADEITRETETRGV